MRIVVKNLPESSKREEIEKFFSTNSSPTDYYMLNDQKGRFRRTCFIGYKTDKEAEDAVAYYDKNMFKNHKIRVERARDAPVDEVKSNESVGRKILYSKTVLIRQMTKMTDPDLVRDEIGKIGPIEDFKIVKSAEGCSAIVKFRDGKHALKMYEEVKIILGMRVKIGVYNENPIQKKREYYNTLFFNFDTIIKKTAESEHLDKRDLVNLKDGEIGTRMAMLEANLVEQTKTFLANNGIYLDSITEEKKKNVLMIRNSDVLGVLDLIKDECKVEMAPSRCLALLTFKDDASAMRCYKDLNLRRYKNQIIFCEFAPICTIPAKVESSKIEKDDKKKINKIIVKNVPFQATQKELKDIFSSYVHVTDVRLPVKADGTIKGYAFIVLDSSDNVEKALDYFGTNTHLYGRRLVLERAKS